MKRTFPVSTKFQPIVEALASPPALQSLSPIAARSVSAIRLIAAHQRAGRDPLPELVVRLRSVEAAAKALTLAQAITSCWPENVHVSRFCCSLLSHDETTIGALTHAAAACDRPGFEAAISGLIRPERHHRLWEATLAYVAAEARSL